MSDTVVFVPAWNEEQNLPAVLGDLRRELPDVDVLVVDDGSTDGTAEAFAAGRRGALLGRESGLPVGIAAGYGWALEHGYAFCGRVDADGQHPALELARLLALVKSDHCDVAVGSRFVSETATASYRYRPSLHAGWHRVAPSGHGPRAAASIRGATSGLYAVNAKALPLLAETFTTEAPEVEALIRIVDAGLRPRRASPWTCRRVREASRSSGAARPSRSS